MSDKSCFVICPIGEPGSPTRKRSDQLLRHVIEPAAISAGYSKERLLRADKLPNPGIITGQIIDSLLKSDLVIADLTDHNPNVFYELAIRHAVRKPIVQLILVGQKIPFDISQMRTVQYNLEDPDELLQAVERIQLQIKAVEQNPSEADNPISTAIDIQTMRSSADPNVKANAEILSVLQTLSGEIASLKQQSYHANLFNNPQIRYSVNPVQVEVDYSAGVNVSDFYNKTGKNRWTAGATNTPLPLVELPKPPTPDEN